MTGLFPPGKGGGEEVAYGGKGKGILIHTLTEGNGMPLTNSTTPANGNEREQVLPLLDISSRSRFASAFCSNSLRVLPVKRLIVILPLSIIYRLPCDISHWEERGREIDIESSTTVHS
ncbi:MAG: hypothetical protein V7K36_04040 [Nostoc sp.]